MGFHPLANVLPLMEGEPFAELVADIKANGLREPVMVFEGQILDGRNRFRACQEIGVQPDLEYLNGQDPVAFVLSMNVHRRHLTTSQRALIAAELANMPAHRPSKSANLQTSVEQAAKLLNVSPRSVASATVVRDHGTEEEKAAVRSGLKKASRVAENIREREKRRANGARPGARLQVPDGKTVEEWCREGLAKEAKGEQPAAAAKAIGFNPGSYRQARDIVLLSERDDLLPRDIETARNAVGERAATAKLSEADVLALREASGSTRSIGAQFGVASSRVSQIKTRKSWSHL